MIHKFHRRYVHALWFEENRERFGKIRSRAVKAVRDSDRGGPQVLRGLRKNVFG